MGGVVPENVRFYSPLNCGLRFSMSDAPETHWRRFMNLGVVANRDDDLAPSTQRGVCRKKRNPARAGGASFHDDVATVYRPLASYA